MTIVKSLEVPEHGYPHRIHRSPKNRKPKNEKIIPRKKREKMELQNLLKICPTKNNKQKRNEIYI